MTRFWLWALLSLVALGGEAAAQQQIQPSQPFHYISVASTNANNVVASRILLREVIAINTTTTLYYLKLYDKATAPTCGTDTPKWTIPVPFGSSNAGGGFTWSSVPGVDFRTGFGFCLVGGIDDSDSSNAATGLAINFGVATR